MTNLRSYLPDGVLDEFCARLVDLDEDARKEVAPHRSVRDVWEYRFGEHRIVAKGYDDADEGRDEYRIMQTLWTGGFGPGSRHRVPEPLAYLTDRRAGVGGTASLCRRHAGRSRLAR